MSERLCRNRRHPITERRPGGCRECQREQHRFADLMKPGGFSEWARPALDAAAAERFTAWRNGLGAAIVVMRHREGFDGRRRGWRTLGECLPTEPAS